MFETTVDCRLFDTKMAADFEDIKIEKVKTEQLFLKLERERERETLERKLWIHEQ